MGGGTPENAVLLVDPSSSDALYIANYYKQARDIPDVNVIYVAPGAANYATFADRNLDALFGSLANRNIGDHIDYVILPPGSPFFVSAPGYISDGCSPVNRLSLTAAYFMAFNEADILNGTVSTATNFYYRNDNTARAFDSSVRWLFGSPSTNSAARYYFLSALLGYSGPRGNTLSETIAMIDRSVAADGTIPPGTFYYMQTTDQFRSPPRHDHYPAMVTALEGLGAAAEHLYDVLPVGRHDALGIMTGWASPAIATTDMAILPGAFCDHLTSWAATFDNGSQTKVSAWIAKGASGSWGTVEEPCNYPGKFPHPRVHVFYFQGLSLGEAAFRAAAYVPFQGLLYGDPLTRPFATLPEVEVPDAPTEAVQDVITLTPVATTALATAAIAGFDLLIDGVLHSSVPPGAVFTVDTALLADGWHDVRVLAYDDTLVKSTGRWRGELLVNNHGRAALLTLQTTNGNWTTPFPCNITTAGPLVNEVRVVQNGRVVAAAPGSAALLTTYGHILGAGPVTLQAEALYADGMLVRSAPVLAEITASAGQPGGQPPAAFSYTKRLLVDQPALVELPHAFDDPNVPLTFEIVAGPQEAEIPAGQTGPARLVRPHASASGADTFTFRITSAAGNSGIATVTLDFGVLHGDLNCDGIVNFADINPFVLALANPAGWQLQYPDCPSENGDINGDGVVGFTDINRFVILLSRS